MKTMSSSSSKMVGLVLFGALLATILVVSSPGCDAQFSLSNLSKQMMLQDARLTLLSQLNQLPQLQQEVQSGQLAANSQQNSDLLAAQEPAIANELAALRQRAMNLPQLNVLHIQRVQQLQQELSRVASQYFLARQNVPPAQLPMVLAQQTRVLQQLQLAIGRVQQMMAESFRDQVIRQQQAAQQATFLQQQQMFNPNRNPMGGGGGVVNPQGGGGVVNPQGGGGVVNPQGGGGVVNPQGGGGVVNPQGGGGVVNPLGGGGVVNPQGGGVVNPQGGGGVVNPQGGGGVVNPQGGGGIVNPP